MVASKWSDYGNYLFNTYLRATTSSAVYWTRDLQRAVELL